MNFMENKHNFDYLIERLSLRLNLNFSLSTEGTCRIFFDGDEVNFEVNNEVLYIYAPLCDSKSLEYKTCINLLKENHLGDNFLSISPQTMEVCLNLVITSSEDYDRFEQHLSQFVDKLRRIKIKIETNDFEDSKESEQHTYSLSDLMTHAISV